ncbi:MAG: sigma-70 family RNA polymerase sigma factor [bacterium]|nr:sigma-70 family RNA polymerase sigma factor [bacterium]
MKFDDTNAITSDEEDVLLVQRTLTGNTNEFGKLVKKYQNVIYSLTRHYIRNEEDRKELVQDIFLRVYSRLSRYDISRRFFTWLYSVSLNFIRNWAARKKFSTVRIDRVPEVKFVYQESLHSPSVSPEEQAIRKEEIEGLYRIVDKLMDKYKNIIILYYFQELSYKEISQILNIPLNTVKIRLFRAKELLGREAKRMKLF